MRQVRPILCVQKYLMDYEERITSAWHENLHLGNMSADFYLFQKVNDFLKTKLMENGVQVTLLLLD